MYHWVQKCHHELQLPEQMRLAIMQWYQDIVWFVLWTKTRLSTLTPPQSWPIAIQAKGSF